MVFKNIFLLVIFFKICHSALVRETMYQDSTCTGDTHSTTFYILDNCFKEDKFSKFRKYVYDEDKDKVVLYKECSDSFCDIEYCENKIVKNNGECKNGYIFDITEELSKSASDFYTYYHGGIGSSICSEDSIYFVNVNHVQKSCHKNFAKENSFQRTICDDEQNLIVQEYLDPECYEKAAGSSYEIETCFETGFNMIKDSCKNFL